MILDIDISSPKDVNTSMPLKNIAGQLLAYQNHTILTENSQLCCRFEIGIQ